jgi:hypothetical protein
MSNTHIVYMDVELLVSQLPYITWVDFSSVPVEYSILDMNFTCFKGNWAF